MIKALIYDINDQELQQAFNLLCAQAEQCVDVLSQADDLFVEVNFFDEQEIRELNLHFRGQDNATDVLSFACLDKNLPFLRANYPTDYDELECALNLGQTAFCLSIVEQQAQEYGNTLHEELCYLFVHSLLHLCGYDHMTEQDKSKMREMEEKILKRGNYGQ